MLDGSNETTSLTGGIVSLDPALILIGDLTGLAGLFWIALGSGFSMDFFGALVAVLSARSSRVVSPVSATGELEGKDFLVETVTFPLSDTAVAMTVWTGFFKAAEAS